MKPLSSLAPLGLAVLLLAPSTSAQQSSPAQHMPGDVFAYFEVDAGALDRGLHQLDLIQLFDDPEFASFFEPLFGQIGADPARPFDSLYERLPIDQFLAGHAAIGLRGVHLWVEQPDGRITEVEVSPSSPITLRQILDVAGMMASMRADMQMGMMGMLPEERVNGWMPANLNIEVGIDLVAVLEPGPMLREHVHQVLSDPAQSHGMITDVHQDDVSGRQVTHLSLNLEQTKGVVSDLYADLNGDTWVITTSIDTFQDAISGSDALANNADFVKVHQRMTSADPVVFAYGNTGDEMKILENFLPPVLLEANETLGFDSYAGSGFALSMTEGGIRESWGVVFDGDRRGVFSLLDSMPAGVEMTRLAPPNAVGLAAIKFDPAILHQRLLELADSLLPGIGDRLAPMMATGFSQTGFDLEADFLNVFGDELSLVQFASEGLMIPDWLVSLDIKDMERARQLLAHMQGMMEQQGAPIRFVDTEIGDGIAAQKLVIQGFPMMPPVMTIAGGKLMIAAKGEYLVDALNTWGSGPSMASTAVYQRTMRGLTGGNDDNAAVLMYSNLKETVPPALMMVMGMLPWGIVDVGAAPELEYFEKHFGGMALAIRNDDDGFSVDTFSPTGMILPLMALGLVFAESTPAQIYEQPYAQAYEGIPEPKVAEEPSSANDFNDTAWYMVRYEGSDEESYREGLNYSVQAVELEPNNHWFLNTLGVAMYRTKQYQGALDVLKHAEALNLASDNSYDPASDVLFQAMCHHHLGNTEMAVELLDRAGNMVGPGSDEEINRFYSEALELIRD